MNLHEYQARALLKAAGVPVPDGDVAATPGEAEALARRIGGTVVVKALVFEGETGMDYWVDAIVNRGIYYTRDDLLGLCKFAGTPDSVIPPSFKDLYGRPICAAIRNRPGWGRVL